MSTAAEKVTPISGAPSANVKPFYLRLAEVQGELERIGKTGVNKEQGYKFVEEAAIMDAVKPLLTERGIFMTMKQVAGSQKIEQVTYGKNDTRAFRADVDMELMLIDGYDPTVREVYAAHAYALDAGDKALQKALTSAGKYAVLRAFMISTGADLDNDGHGLGDGREVRTGNGAPAKATTKQIGFLTQLVTEAKLSDKEIGELAFHETGIRTEKLSELTVDGASKLIECVKSQAYVKILSRSQAAAPAQTPPANGQSDLPDDDPIVTEQQAQIIHGLFQRLRATDRDIAKNVSNHTRGQTTDIAKMRTSDARRLYKTLNAGIMEPAD